MPHPRSYKRTESASQLPYHWRTYASSFDLQLIGRTAAQERVFRSLIQQRTQRTANYQRAIFGQYQSAVLSHYDIRQSQDCLGLSLFD